MKKLVLVLILIVSITFGFSQETGKSYNKLPSVDIKTLNGETFNTKSIENDGKPIIITFWATWCKPCIKEHDAINEEYVDWVDETGVKMYAISIDNARSSKRVLPFVNGKSWEFEVLSDENGDFKRAMSVNVPPHTFILDGDKNVVWQHVGYFDGDESEYIEVVEKIVAGEKIN